MRTALAVRHVHFEDLGIFGPVLDAHGYEVAYAEAGIDDLAAIDPAAPDLLACLLEFNHNSANDPRWMIVKAKTILGGFLLQSGREKEASQVKENLAGLPLPVLSSIELELLTLTERSFWEVTDRQVNFEWIEPENRESVKSFIDSLKASMK